MGKVQWFLGLLLILAVGSVLRLYALGSIPHGLAWDEAAIGYNGFAIVQTRRDEWLQRLPVSFRSFGDYKAPLAIYINGVSTAIFGVHPFGVRLPFAFAGSVAILVFAGVIFELWHQETAQKHVVLFGALLLALSPWHLHYSRVAFESGLALLFMLIAVFGFLKFVAEPIVTRQLLWIGISTMSASLALYSYHSAKVALPFLFLGLAIVYRKSLLQKVKSSIIGISVASVLLFPLLQDAIQGEGLTRANVSVFSKSDSIVDALIRMVQHFFAHLQHQFLVLGQTTSLRHGDGVWGVLLPTTYILVLIAMGFLAVNLSSLHSKFETTATQPKIQRTVVALLWICAGLLPAAIGTEIPHSNRAFLALPGFLLLAVQGLHTLWEVTSKLSLNNQLSGSHGETNLVPKCVIGTVLMAHILLSATQVNAYYTDYAANSAAAFSDGYIEAFELAMQYEKGIEGKPEVDTVLFSDAYGQPYIYALFVRKTDPIWYQGGSLIKYQFAAIKDSDLTRQNALIVATPNEGLPIELADHIVYGSDGSVRFQLYHTPK